MTRTKPAGKRAPTVVDPARPNSPAGPKRKTFQERKYHGPKGRIGHQSYMLRLLDDDILYELEAVLHRGRRRGPGRPPQFPPYAMLAYPALLWGWGTYEEVDANLVDSWEKARDLSIERWPKNSRYHLPKKVPTYSHFMRYRNKELLEDDVWDVLHYETFMPWAAEKATGIGLLTGTPQRVSSPEIESGLFGDAKTIRPMYDTLQGETLVHPETGELIPVRNFDPDVETFIRGDRKEVRGTTFAAIMTRRPGKKCERVVLGLDNVRLGSEAAVSMQLIEAAYSLLPDAQWVAWDRVLRGVHMQKMMQMGLMPLVKVVEKPKQGWFKLDGVTASKASGEDTQIEIYLVRGVPTFKAVTVEGEQFVALQRDRSHPRQAKSGRWSWRNEYVVPDHALIPRELRMARIFLRVDDHERQFETLGWGRAENLRLIDYTDPDWSRLHGRRNDPESTNRRLEDWLWTNRAHSLGIARQRIDLLGFAIGNNLTADMWFEARMLGSTPRKLLLAA